VHLSSWVLLAGRCSCGFGLRASIARASRVTDRPFGLRLERRMLRPGPAETHTVTDRLLQCIAGATVE